MVERCHGNKHQQWCRRALGTSTYSGSFSFSGTCLTFTVPFTGTYTIECWGAQGGGTNGIQGCGAYVAGTINLKKDELLYIYIGQKGSTTNSTGAWNGGGKKGTEANDGCGGGSTDVRLSRHSAGTYNTWGYNSNTNTGDASLKSRIIVAAGGGGSDDGATASNSNNHAGGLHSNAILYGSKTWVNASQTTPGNCNNYNVPGGFGYGNQSTGSACAGGGGGYWGGGASDFGSIGGSCYISGHPGCIAIASASSTSPSTSGSENSIERSTHYSGKVFRNTKMIDGTGHVWTTDIGGLELMPNPSGGSYGSGAGHSGNGCCIISGNTIAP